MSTQSNRSRSSVWDAGSPVHQGWRSSGNCWRATPDAVVPVPRDRFDVAAWYDPRPGTPDRLISRHGGFLDGVFDFDAAFFGISPREARTMDPQQRLLLHVVWEAFEDTRHSALHGPRQRHRSVRRASDRRIRRRDGAVGHGGRAGDCGQQAARRHRRPRLPRLRPAQARPGAGHRLLGLPGRPAQRTPEPAHR